MYQVGINHEGDSLDHSCSIADGGAHESIDTVGKDAKSGQTPPGTRNRELPSKVENLPLLYFLSFFSS